MKTERSIYPSGCSRIGWDDSRTVTKESASMEARNGAYPCRRLQYAWEITGDTGRVKDEMKVQKGIDHAKISL